MKLVFKDNGTTWDKLVYDLSGRLIFEQRNIVLFPEQRTTTYFDEWENQLRNVPWWNIVQVERFL